MDTLIKMARFICGILPSSEQFTNLGYHLRHLAEHCKIFPMLSSVCVRTVILMADPYVWHCCRQRAGTLVKECRALRPRFRADDSALDHRAKAELKKYQKSAVNRRQVDRLEIRLAVLGPLGTHYTLTFDDEHLPRDFSGVRRALRAFFARVKRYLGDSEPLDYIYAIEGLHGDHRYHIHFVAPYNRLSPAEVAYLWRQGSVDDEPVLRTRSFRDPESGAWVKVSDGGYLRVAEYLNKERTDGIIIPIGRHPWSCSRSLNAKVPAPEIWMDSTNAIEIPNTAIWARRGSMENDFGAYYYASWIEGTH